MGLRNKRRRIVAVVASANGQPFQVIALSKVEIMAEGRKAYFDRRGPGHHKMRALGWIEAYHEEQEELEARREERLGNF